MTDATGIFQESEDNHGASTLTGNSNCSSKLE